MKRMTISRFLLVTGLIFIVMTLIGVDFFSALAANLASIDVICWDSGLKCPKEYDGCDTCPGGWKVRYKECERYNCEDGSYVCKFLGYSYGTCGICYE